MKILVSIAALAAAIPAAAATGRPAWVAEPVAPVRPEAVVATVVGGTEADVVVLEGGTESGLRPGQMLDVRRAAGTQPHARLLVARVGTHRSAALPVHLEAGSDLAPGDQALARIR